LKSVSLPFCTILPVLLGVPPMPCVAVPRLPACPTKSRTASLDVVSGRVNSEFL
jgi:hypothetical protein